MSENQKNYNEGLVKLVAPIILNIPVYFRTNVFTRESVQMILIAANCPEDLTDVVIDNCELAGILSTSDNGKTITIITQTND